MRNLKLLTWKIQINYEFTNNDNVYIVAWTTTPWTLPGNVALAVGTDINYVMVKIHDDLYILAKDRLEIIDQI